MTKQAQDQHKRSIDISIQYWQKKLVQAAAPADRSRPQHDTIKKVMWEAERWDDLYETAVSTIPSIFRTIERWGYWYEWLPLIQKLLKKPIRNDRDRIRLMNVLGRIYHLNRDFKTAVSTHEDALKLAQAADKTLLAACKYHLCNDHLEQLSFALARQYGEEALAYFEQAPADDLFYVPALNNSLGVIALKTGEVETAVVHLQAAQTQWESVGDAMSLVRTLNNLALARWTQKAWDEAVLIFQQVLEILGPTASYLDQMRALNGLGSAYYRLKAFAQAEQTFRQGLQLATAVSSDVHVQGSLAHNLGNTLLAQQRYGESEAYLKRSQHLWQRANDAVQEGNTVGTLAELKAEAGELEAAIEYYAEALALLLPHADYAWAHQLIQTFKQAKEKCEKQLAAR